MSAQELLEAFGGKLIGRKVITERYGEWPGGSATIIELRPDPDDPGIVFQVRHETEVNPEMPGDIDSRWEIGVFGHENVKLV